VFLQFGLVPRCAELRGFAPKFLQTVEQTVKEKEVPAFPRGKSFQGSAASGPRARALHVASNEAGTGTRLRLKYQLRYTATVIVE
jgi:hypothetical protein